MPEPAAMLAFLLGDPTPPLLIEGHHFISAGFVALILGLAKACLGRKHALGRLYILGLFFGASLCLVALGIFSCEDGSCLG